MFQTNTSINVCRICIQEATDAIDLFAELDESKEVLNKLQLCFHIIIKKGMDLPTIICNYCVNELNAADKFRVKCITSEERFLSFCKQLSDNVKDEVKDLFEVGEEHYTDLSYGADTDKNASEFDNQNKSFAVSEGIEKERFHCSICGRIFKKNESLIRHISMHEGKSHVGKVTGFGATRRYHCKNCSYSTPYSQTLVTHMRRHTGEKPHVCECGKRFSDSSSFKSHCRSHSNNTYYTCSTCGKQFKVNKAFRQHLRCHESPKYACDICQKVLKSRQTLRDHLRRHSNIRNFNCEDCGDTFVTSSELIHHKKKHISEKNLVCNLCGYKTLRRGNLRVHLQRHTNDKPHKCEICEASFYTRQNARRHQQVHARNKACICPICLKGFTRSQALSKHLEKTHGAQSMWDDHKVKECLKKNKININKNNINDNNAVVDAPMCGSELSSNIQ